MDRIALDHWKSRHHVIANPTSSRHPRVVPRDVITALTKENSRNIKVKLAILEKLHKVFENRNNALLWGELEKSALATPIEHENSPDFNDSVLRTRRDALKSYARVLKEVENRQRLSSNWMYFDNTSELRRIVEKELARISKGEEFKEGEFQGVTGFTDKESKAAYKRIKEAHRFWKSVSKVDEQCRNIRLKQMQTVRILRKFNPPILDKEIREAIPSVRIRHKLQKRRPYRLADTGRIFPYKNIRLPATSGRIVRKLQKKKKAAYCSAP